MPTTEEKESNEKDLIATDRPPDVYIPSLVQRSGSRFPIEIVIPTPTTEEKESNEKDPIATDRPPDVDVPSLDAILRDTIVKDTVKLEWHPDALGGSIDSLGITPIRVLERLSPLSCRLDLPVGSRIHDVVSVGSFAQV